VLAQEVCRTLQYRCIRKQVRWWALTFVNGKKGKRE
jgi:hypothetical protein